MWFRSAGGTESCPKSAAVKHQCQIVELALSHSISVKEIFLVIHKLNIERIFFLTFHFSVCVDPNVTLKAFVFLQPYEAKF